jgi:hypothetical protein
MSAFDRLIEQIDAFIRKYYKNELLKGLLYFIGVLFASWLLVSTLEFFGRFSSTVRFSLFVAFIVGNSIILIHYFIRPLAKLVAFGARISREQAARIIGTFFPAISDRLLNTLQLQQVANPNDRSYELIAASVAQKSKDLLIVPFSEAIRFSDLRKYLKYVLPVLLIFAAVFVFSPALIVDGSTNVVNYNQAQKAPFNFINEHADVTVKEGESFAAMVALSGAYLPEKVYVVSERGRFLMAQTRKNKWSFTFDNMKSDGTYFFESEGYQSPSFKVHVLGRSSLGQLAATVLFPAYLKRKSEQFNNVADIEIPEGSTIKWSIVGKNANRLAVQWLDKTTVFNGNSANFEAIYKQSGPLKITLKNNYNSDVSSVQITTIKDAYPSILVNESVDSMNNAVRSFAGLINDDYGLHRLSFHYTITTKEGKQRANSLSVKKVSGTADKFFFTVDFSRENLAIEDKIAYYFTVADNDGVNGSKSTQSQTFVYELPTLNELNNKRDETQNQLQSSLADVLKKAERFENEVDRLKKSLAKQNKTDYKNLEQIQQLKQEQNQLQQDLQQIQETLSQSNEEKNQLSEQDKELLEQQELIDQLLNEVMDDDLKKLLDELESLLEKNDQQQLKEETQKLDQSTDDMKKQLDRTLEMLKKMQVNEKIDDAVKELKALAKEQDELKEASENKKLSEEDASKKQEEINKQFEELKKDLNELNKLNEGLTRPMNLSDLEQLKNETTKDLNEAKSKLDQGKSSKAAQNQKSAAQKMQEMADQLAQDKEAANKQQNEEDMGLIRVLLENLIAVSFDQEKTMQSALSVRDTDPYYRKLGRKQRSIIDDTKIIEDSLIALAKRQPKISTFINRELSAIRSNFQLLIDDIDEHKRRELSAHQQLVMTSLNNLALLLNESLQSMQQQAQNQQKGNGSCSNPGGSGKGSSGGESLGDMKEQLKKQLEQLKKGPNPGGKEPGNKPGEGNAGMPGLGNKQIAQMAAQQTAIRQKLEQMRSEMNKDGQGAGNKLNPLIKELEQQERDLINKNFSNQLIKRQQDILTRLLESEQAIRERGFDEKRESKSGNNSNNGNLIRFDEYNKQKLIQLELLRPVDPQLTRYYRSIAEQYFNSEL